MADNVRFSTSAAGNPPDDLGVAADKVTYSGDANVDVQLMRPVHVEGAEGSKTVVGLVATADPASDAAGLVVRSVPGSTPQPVSGPVTDAELRATPVPVSVSGVANAENQASEIAALGAPADAEASGNGSIIAILKKLRSLLSGTLTITGAVTTDFNTSGLATGAKQDTGNTSLASVDTKIGEVQASPTSNTVLARLKDLLTGIVLAAGANIIGKVGIDQTTPGTTNKVSIGSDGVVQANAGTNLNTSALALESGGNLASAATSAAAINTATGAQADAEATGNGSVIAILKRLRTLLGSVITALGTPFQAGGSIGNTSFGSTVADGANVTLGAKADAKSTATDTTAITAMSVWKQISASVQAIASAIAGTLTVSGTVTTSAPTSSTGTSSNVAGSASNVTLLASNGSRKGATIFNDSTAVLYVKFGATASSTSFAVKMAGGGYLEVPFGYTGVIDGLWASATGSARVTELT